MSTLHRDQSDDRTEAPSAKRLADARRRGHTPRSADFGSAVVVLAAIVLLSWLGPVLVDRCTEMTASLLDGRSAPLAGPNALAGAAWRAAQGLLWVVAALATFLVAVVVTVGLLQVGFVHARDAIHPNLRRIDPFSGLRRLASGRTLLRGVLAGAKVAAVPVVFIMQLQVHGRALAMAADGSREALVAAAHAGRSILLHVSATLLGVCLLDLMYQRWQFAQDLKMSRREKRDERREAEGDERIRRRRRKALAGRRQNRDGVNAIEENSHV
jgi:flagellar biosynthesis protein FlhB